MATIHLNANTKKMQMYLSRWLDRHDEYVRLEDCYARPSEEKQDAYFAIRKTVPYDYLSKICVLSASPKIFTMGYYKPDPRTMKLCFYVHTHKNVYWTELEGSTDCLAQRVLGIR